MRQALPICILLFFSSCFNSESRSYETDELNQRIIPLEQRIDSLINAGNTNPAGIKNKSENTPVSYGVVRQTSRCQAITKKGTQCKRTAKNNGYCWQHGG
jgi:uncharacterized protein DUF5763